MNLLNFLEKLFMDEDNQAEKSILAFFGFFAAFILAVIGIYMFNFKEGEEATSTLTDGLVNSFLLYSAANLGISAWGRVKKSNGNSEQAAK